jgi:hypothetical protein
VDIDKAGHHHEAAAVDGLAGLALVIAPGESEHAILEGDIAAGDISVILARCVPGDDIVGIADDCNRHVYAPTLAATVSGSCHARQDQQMSNPALLFGSCNWR